MLRTSTALTLILLCLACQPSTTPTNTANGPSASATALASSHGGKWKEHTQGLPFVIGYQEGKNRSKATGKPRMFFVTATWCGWCKKLAKDNFTDSDIKTLLDNFVCVIVDGDGAAKERAAARHLGAQGFPHIVFESKEGKNLGVVRGYLPPEQFKARVEKVLKSIN
jgi:thioredoxin-related protein